MTGSSCCRIGLGAAPTAPITRPSYPGMFTRFKRRALARRKGSTKRRACAPTRLSRSPTASIANVLCDSGDGFDALLEAQAIVYIVSNTEIERQSNSRVEQPACGEKAVRSFNSLRVDDLREGLRVLDESETKLAQLATPPGKALQAEELCRS